MNTLNVNDHRPVIPYGLVVRIPAFHAGGPGSIPGVGAYILYFLKKNLLTCNPLKRAYRHLMIMPLILMERKAKNQHTTIRMVWVHKALAYIL